MEGAQQSVEQLLERGFTPIDTFEVAGLVFTPSYLHAAAVVFLIFLLILTFARLRRMYVNWSMKGSIAMIGFGFMLAIIVEGFLLLGGRTIFTELLGWENPPEPVVNTLDIGREKLVEVLGENQEIPLSVAQEEVTAEFVIGQYQSLPGSEATEVKNIICAP